MISERDNKAVNAIRFLSVDMIQKANSGHPGLPLDAAPMAYTLWEKIMNFNPDDPNWINRDRFVLSAGHGSAMLYSLLHLNQFGLKIDDLKEFRQLNSLTPGHPEFGHTKGVDVTTGPLAQGLGMAVGMAMAEKHLAAVYNRPGFPVFDHNTYVIAGDGDLMEGLSHEAINIAGDKQLNKLIVLYDSNDISLDGPLSLSSNDSVEKRFIAAKWDYQKVNDGNDIESVLDALKNAQNSDKPSLIEVKTIIGYGTPEQGTNKVHGSALGEANVAAAREFYNWKLEPFEISTDIYDTYKKSIEEKKIAYNEWTSMVESYQEEYGSLYEKFTQNKLDISHLKSEYKVGEIIATRTASQTNIQQLTQSNDNFWGGSADLSSSNKTFLNDAGTFSSLQPEGKNIFYGVREFGMAAALNGILLHGGSRSFASTFFVFSDYMKPAIRLAAIQSIPSTFIFSHDSLAVGEDGPTHEPVEQLAALRSIPNIDVFRPADANETLAAWKTIANITDRPSALVLSRQKLPVLEQTKSAPVEKGAYTISSSENKDADGILIATGSEVSLALEVQKKLRKERFDVSVVSMPSMELFKQQSKEYQESILPLSIDKRISIEMGSTQAWGTFTGLSGINIGVDTFGASGKGPEVVESYGFTVDNIVKKYKDLWSKTE